MCSSDLVTPSRVEELDLKVDHGAIVTSVEPGTAADDAGIRNGDVIVQVDGLDVHGNPNVLTRDAGTSKLAQGPIAHTCLVDVARFEGELPPITCFSPPRIVADADAMPRDA